MLLLTIMTMQFLANVPIRRVKKTQRTFEVGRHRKHVIAFSAKAKCLLTQG